MKQLIPGLLVLFLLMGTASADVGYHCVDENSFYNWTMDGELHNVTEPCKFGCDETRGVCQNEPVGLGFYIALILGFVGISFIMAYLAMNIDRKEHGAIQVLFIFLSLYGAWATLGAIAAILEIQSITRLEPLNIAYFTILQWGAIAVLFYVFIMMIWNLYKYLITLKGRRKDGLEPTRGAGVRF